MVVLHSCSFANMLPAIQQSLIHTQGWQQEAQALHVQLTALKLHILGWLVRLLMNLVLPYK